MNTLVLLGSARGGSHTAALVDSVFGDRPVTRIDLRDVAIHHYEYDRPMDRDGFANVARAMTGHRLIVFATPVYWYSMSGRMKVLIDRFTDLVTVRKDIGRQLHGRHIAVLACGSEPALPEGFEVPFRETAAYLNMAYRGTFYAQTTKQGLLAVTIESARQFGERLFEGTP